MKKYEAYKDSGIEWIGMIPEGWNIVPLKYYLSLKGRIGWKGLKSDEFEEKSYAYLVTGQDFTSDVVDWSKCYQINRERYDEDPFIQLENGDLLVTKDGTIGKIAKVKNLDKPACLQNYLYWVLVSNQLTEFVGFNSTGSTIQHLYQNVFENMPLTVPSLPEQQAIADYLDYKVGQIDTSVAGINTQIEDLKAYRQAVISEAVTKVAQKGAKAVRGNSAGSFGGSGKYAKGWTYQSEYRRLGSVATIYNKTPGLPHLLENGHAKRGGGRVSGRTHIAPVETEIITEYERAIQEVATR